MAFKKISVLIPTRQRLDRLQTLLDSYEHTTRLATAPRSDAELVFRVDDDDTETQHFLRSVGHRMVVGSRHRGYESMPLFFNEMLLAAKGDVLMCGNDDMVFKTAHWPYFMLEAANQYPDGLFDLGVSTLNETHYPFSTVSRRVVERLGFIWDPRIFWGDIYLRDVMAAFGRAVMVPFVRIDHDWAGFKPDKVYLEQLQPGESGKDILRRDPNYWSTTHARAVNDAVDKLKELLT